MPELPEVETIKNILKPHIIRLTIENVKINNKSVIACPCADEFTAKLKGQTFIDIIRCGKFLIFCLSSGDRLILHLRMTGCLTVANADEPLTKHTHVVFVLSDKSELRYEDVRRFGKFWFIGKWENDEFSGIDKLGIEPFDGGFNVEYLKRKIVNSKKPIKELLLDQSIVAGIGNIYSDEICFVAKILPYRSGNSLTDDEIQALYETIPKTLEYFVKTNEISFEEYNLGKGKDYRNTPYLRVYGKKGQPCPTCGTSLSGKTIGGRSCVYCSHCQK